MSIDMNEEATPANTSSTVGTREACARINENNFLDADEDLPDGLVIDITAEGVSLYSNNGTPGDPSDDSGGLYAYTFYISYTAAFMTVTYQDANLPAVNMLARNSGSSIFNFSDAVPDDNDNNWMALAIDDGSYPPLDPESGDGVLHRIWIESDSLATGGLYPLTLVNAEIADVSGYSHFPTATNNGEVAINTPCLDIDGDNVPDAQDACTTFPGPPSNNGCPPPGPPAVGGTAGLLTAPDTVPSARAGSEGDSSLLSNATLLGASVLAVAAGVTLLLRRRRRRRRTSA